MEKTIDLLKQAQARLQEAQHRIDEKIADYQRLEHLSQKAGLIYKEIVSILQKQKAETEVGLGPSISVLSERELEVFKLMGQGLKPGQIAKELKIAAKTAYGHREEIKKKLHLGSTFELEKVAQDMLKNQSDVKQ